MGNPTVGEIPEHWEFTTLGEVCDRGEGKIQAGPFGSQLHASDYVPVGIPSVMPVNIGVNRLVESDIKRITEEDAERLSKHRVVPGDIIYSRRGDVERRALVREEQRGWLCGTGCMKVRLGEGVVDPPFASFYLDHPQVREWIVQHAVGATMPNLNTSIMRAIPFALPPIEEQRAIASILGALDDKIELNRRMNATLESLARAIFKSWFVDFDPVRSKSGQQAEPPSGTGAATATSPPPRDLFPFTGNQPPTVQDLIDCGVLQMGDGYRAKRIELAETGLPFVRAGNLQDGGFAFEKAEFLCEESSTKAGEKNSQPFDVAFTSKGTVGRMTMVTPSTRPSFIRHKCAGGVLRTAKISIHMSCIAGWNQTSSCTKSRWSKVKRTWPTTSAFVTNVRCG